MELKAVKRAIGFLRVMSLQGLYMGTYELNEVGQPGMWIEATYNWTIFASKDLEFQEFSNFEELSKNIDAV